MKGSIYKRCTVCPKRTRYQAGDRRCRDCGAMAHSWYYQVRVGTKEDGKPIQEKKGGFPTKGDAERALRGVLTKLDRDEYIEPSRMTVQMFLEREWLPAVKVRVEATTWGGYVGVARRYIYPHLGHIPLQELRAPTLNRFYAELRTSGGSRGDGTLSLRTVRSAHTILRRACHDAIRWGYLDRNNPCDLADPPSATAVNNARKESIVTWTAEHVADYAVAIYDNEMYPLWMTAVGTGMRRSELLGLRWSDIDFERRVLSVRQVLVVVSDAEGRGSKPVLRGAPKSNNGFRVIDLPEGVIEALKRQKAQQARERLAAGVAWQNNDLVFCRNDGHWFHPDHVTETLRELAATTDLPRIRPLQDLRHTHASLLLAAGEHPKVVQERLGHHSHSFTVDTYTHTMKSMGEAAARRFDDILAPKPKDPGKGGDAGL